MRIDTPKTMFNCQLQDCGQWLPSLFGANSFKKWERGVPFFDFPLWVN
ncbi:hypothetical protein BH10ACI3_BH10ACI3_12250 [soil metagenome]